MTEREQERELGKVVLKLRKREMEQRCLRSKAHDLAGVLKSVLKLHDQKRHDEDLLSELDKLPDNEITSTFRGLVEAKADIERLRRDLGLHWEE